MYWLDVVVTEEVSTKFNLWNWINDNNGTVMCILTLIYVVATAFIWLSNSKSANAAIKANQQSYALALLDKRLKSYYALNDWISIAKTLQGENCGELAPIEAFSVMLFNNPKNLELEDINNQIQSVERKMKEDGITKIQYTELSNTKKLLLQNRFMKRIALLDKECGLISQIEILFPAIKYNCIDDFKKSFVQAVIDQSDNNIDILKVNLQKLIKDDVLKNLWLEMKK